MDYIDALGDSLQFQKMNVFHTLNSAPIATRFLIPRSTNLYLEMFEIPSVHEI